MVGHPSTYKTLETYSCIQQLNGFFVHYVRLKLIWLDQTSKLEKPKWNE